MEVDLAVRADLEKALAKLSLQELELVTRASRDGLTHAEIAQVTRQSRKTVGRKLAALLLPLSPARERASVRGRAVTAA